MKKTILFVINSMGCGGAEKSLLSLLSLINYKKYDITLLMFQRGGMFEMLLPQEVHIHEALDYTSFCAQPFVKQFLSFDLRRISARIQTSIFLRCNAHRGYPLHDAQAYWKYSSKAYDMLPEKYDIAIAWGQGTPTHFVAEKVQANNKFAWVNVNYASAGHQASFDNAYYKEYDAIACVSQELAYLFTKAFPAYHTKIRTILDIKNPEMIFEMAQQPYVLPDQHGFTIMTAGRLVPQKGYDIATEAASLLKKAGFNFHWYVLGEGDRKPIEADIAHYDIADCFTLLGAKPNPYPYIKAADIYVQTSKYEGYCLTLAEARILNVPCVTTAFDVVYAQMVNGENGLVVDINAQAVAEGIIRLMKDKSLYQHIKSYQEHEKKGNVEDIEKFYQLVAQ